MRPLQSLCLLPVAVLLSLAAHAASAETVRSLVSVEGKQIPLPPGDWQRAGSAVTDIHGGAVVSVVLLRVSGKRADAAVLIQTNKVEGSASWGRPSGCERTDFYSAHIRYASDHDGSCAYVAGVDTAPQADQTVDAAWREAVRSAAATGVELPRHWLVAAFRVTDPRDGLQVRYFFSPPPADVDPFVSWSNSAWYAVGSGFRNRIDPAGAPPIPAWPPTGSAASPAQNARPSLEPDSYRDVGLIGLKTVTYRFFGTITDFGVNYLYLGNAATAGGLSLLGTVASSALYFVHELVWRYADAPANEITDLPGIGTELPAPVR